MSLDERIYFLMKLEMLIRFSNSFLKSNFLNNLNAQRIIKRRLCSQINENVFKKKLEYLLVLDFEATCDKTKMEQVLRSLPF